MVARCFVANCTSGYKSNPVKVSLFKAPNDLAMLEKWQKAIPRLDRTLTRKDHVCEKHFLANEVIKDWKAENNGFVLMEVKMRAKLAPEVVPSQFPDSLQHLSKKRTRKCSTLHNFDIIERKKSKQNAIAEETVTVINNQYALKVKDIPGCSNPEKLSFEDLRNNASRMCLPSPMWSVHITDLSSFGPPTMSFICTDFNHEDKRLVILKQVCFDEYLNVKAFVLNKPVTSIQFGFGEAMSTSSLEEVNNIVQALHDRSVCIGGPKQAKYKGVLSETAYVDEWGTWRHVNCSLLCDRELFQCSTCSSVNNTIKVHLNRKKMRSEQKGIRFPCSPGWKGPVKVMQSKMLKKSQALTRKLHDKIKDLQNKIGEISDETLKEKLDKLNLPAAQLMVIMECVSGGKLASKNSRRYSGEWLLMCLLLYIRSPKSYRFMLDQEILPLPCVKTIRNYLIKVKTKCGCDAEFFDSLVKYNFDVGLSGLITKKIYDTP